MKNVLTVIKKEFARFFKDRRMVITVLLPGVLIYILYSVMGAVFADMGAVDENYKYRAYVENAPASVQSTFESYLDICEAETLESAMDMVAAGELELAVVFPENFDEILDGGSSETPEVKVYYNSSETLSVAGYTLVNALLGALNKPLFTVNSSGDFDLASERDTAGSILSMLVPMLMFALLASGCIAVAPEAIAGEKERGTMATILITPINRWELALGKIISLSCFALLSGISSFLGVIFSLPKLMAGAVSGETAAFYSVGDYFMIFGVIISTVLVIISAFSILSAYAKSVKEAGTLITPLMMVIILLGVVTMFVSSAPALGLYAVPVLGGGLAISSIMSFAASPLAVALAIISNLVLAAVLIVVLALMFKSEKIMFNR